MKTGAQAFPDLRATQPDQTNSSHRHSSGGVPSTAAESHATLGTANTWTPQHKAWQTQSELSSAAKAWGQSGAGSTIILLPIDSSQRETTPLQWCCTVGEQGELLIGCLLQ